MGDGEAVRPAFAGWEEKRDELRRRLAARPVDLGFAGPVRLADGEVVEPGARSARAAARQVFLMVAGHAEPALLATLAAAPLDEYAALWDAAGGPPEADPSPGFGPWREGPDVAFLRASVEGRGAGAAWLRRWRLPFLTSIRGWRPGEDPRLAATGAWGPGIAFCTVMGWRARPLPAADRIVLVEPTIRYGVGLEDDLGVEDRLDLPSVRWDPQHETRSEAQARILRELRAAVRDELARIEGAARERGEPSPAARLALEHLVWLARYHFRGESYAAIARAVHRERQTVAEAVHGTAALVGLPLRPPDPPGRPPARREGARIVRLDRYRRPPDVSIVRTVEGRQKPDGTNVR